MNNKKLVYSFLAAWLLLCSLAAKAAAKDVAIEIEPELYSIENSPRRVVWEKEKKRYCKEVKLKAMASGALTLASGGLLGAALQGDSIASVVFSVASILPSYYALKFALQSESSYEKAILRKKALEFQKEKYNRASNALEKEQKKEEWFESGTELDAHLPPALKKTVLDYCKEPYFFLHVITFQKPYPFFNNKKDRTIALKGLEVELENDEACLTTTSGDKFLFGTSGSRTNAIRPNYLYCEDDLVAYVITRSSDSPANS